MSGTKPARKCVTCRQSRVRKGRICDRCLDRKNRTCYLCQKKTGTLVRRQCGECREALAVAMADGGRVVRPAGFAWFPGHIELLAERAAMGLPLFGKKECKRC